MGNLLKVLMFLLTFNLASEAMAQAQIEKVKPTSRTHVQITGFVDYPPFGNFRGYLSGKKEGYMDYYDSAFLPFVREALEEYGFYIEDGAIVRESYASWLNEVKEGEKEILLGAYHDTKIYKGLNYVMPSVIDNNIILIVLPDRINEVKSVDDLKKLKGAINSNEKLTDYVAGEIKKLNVKEFDDNKAMFEQLFNNEIDYILSGYYAGMMMTAELALRENVAFSKSPIWTMPIFLAVSKYSRNNKDIEEALRKASEKNGVRERVKKDFDDVIRKIEEKHRGKVPPEFVTKKANTSNNIDVKTEATQKGE